MGWITPANLLIAAVGLTGGAWGWQWLRHRRFAQALQVLGASRGLTYSHKDHFGLVGRLLAHLPVPGAAAVHVRDLLYGIRGAFRIYACTVEYTTGAMGTRHRSAHAMLLVEPLEDPAAARVYATADRRLSLPAQYEALLENDRARAAEDADPGATSLVAAFGQLARDAGESPSSGTPGGRASP